MPELARLVTHINGHADHVAPFNPRPIVVTYILKTKQVFQYKPRMGRAITHTAIRHSRGVWIEASVDLLQFSTGTEAAVWVY